VIEAVVGYLAVWLLKGGRRFVDRRFDEALEGLWERAVDGLRRSGHGHELREFRRRPLNAYTRDSLEISLQEAMSQNAALAASLERNVRYLDSRDGRRVIAAVEMDPITSKVWWVVALVVLAAVLAFSGFGLFFYAIYQESQETGPSPPGIPPNAARGFGLFFAGLCVLALSGIAHALTKTRL
jgi:hypothetical protein